MSDHKHRRAEGCTYPPCELGRRAYRAIELLGGNTRDLEDKISGQALLVDDLYMITHEGSLHIDRLSTDEPIYTEDHHLQPCFVGDSESVQWALEILRKQLVLFDLAGA